MSFGLSLTTGHLVGSAMITATDWSRRQRSHCSVQSRRIEQACLRDHHADRVGRRCPQSRTERCSDIRAALEAEGDRFVGTLTTRPHIRLQRLIALLVELWF